MPIKNFELLIHAWGEIRIPLDIVGEGPLQSKLERAIEVNRLRDRATLMGYQDDVLERMQQADIVVVLS